MDDLPGVSDIKAALGNIYNNGSQPQGEDTTNKDTSEKIVGK